MTIGNSVTSIGNWSFDGCNSLTNVTLLSNAIVGKSYKTDSNISHIFGSQVTNYIIGDNVVSIGEYAFYDCEGLANVTISNSVTSIGNFAFYGCSSLTSVTIPNSVTSIENHAFYGCSSLTSVTIGNSVTSIEHFAFAGCSSLTSVTIPNSVTSIENHAFYGCSSLTSVTIGNSVTSIGDCAFHSCGSLTNVTIPDSVTSIGDNAFRSCGSLVNLTIGKNVTSIGNYAFSYCRSLTSVVCKATDVPNAAPYAFDYSNIVTDIPSPTSYATLYVPMASLNEYKFRIPWCYFAILPIENTGNDPSNPEDSPKDSITVKAKIPEHWTNTITAWTWGETSSGHWVTPTKEGDWYVVTDNVEELNIIFVNGTNWSGDNNQTIDMTFTANTCIQLAQEGSDKAIYTAIDCEGDDTSKDDEEEDDGAITCEEAVSICQETGTTITTEKYTIRGYVTEIKTAYSEQYNNITFWMADTPTGGQVLQAYRVIPVEANDIDVKVGDYVEVIGSLVNYYGTTPEVYMGGTYTIDCESNDTPKDDEEDDGVITCAEAVSICQETGTTITTEQYTIRGYVTYITSAYSEQYNNITFWMADIRNGGKVLQAYRVIPVEANDIDVKVGDYVEVVGSLVNYYGTTPEVYMGGTYTIIPECVSTDINNIKMPADGSSTKFLRDGQFLILRDGKTYNAQGAVIK